MLIHTEMYLTEGLLFLLCRHGRPAWVLYTGQVLSTSFKSLYLLPGAGLRNNLRFLSE